MGWAGGRGEKREKPPLVYTGRSVSHRSPNRRSAPRKSRTPTTPFGMAIWAAVGHGVGMACLARTSRFALVFHGENVVRNYSTSRVTLHGNRFRSADIAFSKSPKAARIATAIVRFRGNLGRGYNSETRTTRPRRFHSVSVFTGRPDRKP